MTPPKVIRIALATLVGGLAIAGFAAAAGAFSSGAEVRPAALEGAAPVAAGVARATRVEGEPGEGEVEDLDAEGRPVKARVGSQAGAAPTVIRVADDDDLDEGRRSKREGDDD